MDLVTLGTIADIMPLTDENRILVRHGLDALAGTKHPGLRMLLEKNGGGTTARAWPGRSPLSSILPDATVKAGCSPVFFSSAEEGVLEDIIAEITR